MINLPPFGAAFPKDTKMQITEKEIKSLAQYIAEYLAEENVTEPDSFLITNAIDAYIGGAAETE